MKSNFKPHVSKDDVAYRFLDVSPITSTFRHVSSIICNSKPSVLACQALGVETRDMSYPRVTEILCYGRNHWCENHFLVSAESSWL